MKRQVRARDLGIPFDGNPGPLNAITDIDGIEVGHSTIIADPTDGSSSTGVIRTGVTAIFPKPKSELSSVFAGWFSINGNGEMTGTHWIEESGILNGSIMLTNAFCVGIVRDSVIKWKKQKFGAKTFVGALPVVAETDDGWLNDNNSFAVTPEHVFEALNVASGGRVAEGNVGGGTGNVCFEFKGGIGTASRQISCEKELYTVGVLVQSNFGLKPQLTISGVPVGKEFSHSSSNYKEVGSIIVVIATDAPLLPHQLKRLAKRATHGLARTGGVSGNGSGDIFIAFSTANDLTQQSGVIHQVKAIVNDEMDPLFIATVEAVEESIVNALVAAETMTGRDGNIVEALPHTQLQEIMEEHGRLNV